MGAGAILMGIAFSLMWSSAFTSARMIVQDAPPLTALALRFALTGTIAILAARALGQRIRLTRGQWIAVAVFGLCQNALYLGLNFVAMVRIEAGLASIIAAMMPLIVAALGWLAFGAAVRPLGVAGLVAGFSGAALIMGTRLEGWVDLPGVAMCAAGAVALAVATLTVRGASSGGNLVMVVGLQMWVGALVLAPLALLTEVPEVDWTPRLALAFTYTALVPGLLATILWFHLVDRIGPVRAATFHFLNPFFGVAVASLLLGEPLRGWDVAGVAIIAAGILAVQRSALAADPA